MVMTLHVHVSNLTSLIQDRKGAWAQEGCPDLTLSWLIMTQRCSAAEGLPINPPS